MVVVMVEKVVDWGAPLEGGAVWEAAKVGWGEIGVVVEVVGWVGVVLAAEVVG